MYVHRVNNGKRIPQFTCSNYSKIPSGTLCKTQHRVNAEDVILLIKEVLKAIVEFARLDKNAFVKAVTDIGNKKENEEIIRAREKLDALSKREEEIEKLLCRIYEDNALGKLPDERYYMLERQYFGEKYIAYILK